MSRTDRTLIAGLLLEHYPWMKDATSSAWHELLNQETGLSIPLDEDNATAFDTWRKALTAQKSLSVWGITDKQKKEAKIRLAAILKKQKQRDAKQEALLQKLRLEAPGEALVDP